MKPLHRLSVLLLLLGAIRCPAQVLSPWSMAPLEARPQRAADPSRISTWAWDLPGVVDPDLAEFAATIKTLVDLGHPGRAEDYGEKVRNQRRGDPRAWLLMGDSRRFTGGARGLLYAYHHAGAIGSDAVRDVANARLAQLDLPPLPPRVRIGDVEGIEDGMVQMACFEYARRITVSPKAFEPWPSVYPPKEEWQARCKPIIESGRRPRSYPHSGPDPEWNARSVTLRLAADPDRPWIRERAVAHAAHEDFDARLMKILADEPTSLVRSTVLTRLYSLSGTPMDSAWVDAVAAEYLTDEDPWVRGQAVNLLGLRRAAVAVPLRAFQTLLLRVGDGGPGAPAALRYHASRQPELLDEVRRIARGEIPEDARVMRGQTMDTAARLWLEAAPWADKARLLEANLYPKTAPPEYPRFSMGAAMPALDRLVVQLGLTGPADPLKMLAAVKARAAGEG